MPDALAMDGLAWPCGGVTVLFLVIATGTLLLTALVAVLRRETNGEGRE